MATIRTLFDPGKDINRSIEKVITYSVSQEARLRAEISEYVVTDSIERQMEQLLEKMQSAMDAGGGHEVGVWVSGFYGSGKSSFTKYLGLAFDGHIQIDGQPFLKHLQNRLKRATTKALLNTVAARFPAAIVMLDLASEQIAGATLAEVSTVLYHKTLQHAGYSRNVKVAAFERKLKKDGRYAEFETMFQDEVGLPWRDLQNDELVVDSLLPGFAHRMYPTLFRSEQAFVTTTSDVIYLMNDRVREMIEIVRDFSGKDRIIFIIDEIGQYVGSNQNKILDLQGLAQNLKDIGGGKVWIVGTAQQTLTEDDPRAAVNSPELFKLKDRFPISVDLESSDIREICYSRLLGKSPAGETLLGNLFDRNGAQLRHCAKLADAKSYDATLDRTSFINLYPFLPAHFDILLHLLGALAKSTGGIGLRSAIKVVQDILIEGAGRQDPVANRPIGWLATTVTLFDSLDRDIKRAFPQIHHAVEKVRLQFPDDELTQGVAKTIAILQILNNLPSNVQNVAALMHSGVDVESLADKVKATVECMLKHQFIPLMEKDGNLRFFSEKLTDIEHERGQITVRTPDARRIFNAALREVFDPLPTAKVHGSLTVATGLRHLVGGQPMALGGEKETVQILTVFVDPADYDTHRTKLLDESRERANNTAIYLLGRAVSESQDIVGDIYRCERIAEIHRNDPDQEVRDYCASQIERAARLSRDLRDKLSRCLGQGSFLFRGRATAADSLNQEIGKATRACVAEAAEQVFCRYPEAAERVETGLAEKFLRQPNLRSITSQLDPLGLVVMGPSPKIQTTHKGLISIRDFIERTGSVEGKQLLDHFSSHPFGWSPDTVRYMVAALLLATEIKLKVGGREVTVNGQQAIDALKTNQSFKSVGVALRHDRPSMDTLAKAAERLTELCGEQIIPLEDEISKAARQKLPDIQNRLSPLSERLTTLGLPGADTMEGINRQIAAMLQTDASDAPQRFGAAESPLFDGMKWAIAVKNAFDQGVSDTVRQLRAVEKEVAGLPTSGAPGELRKAVQDDISLIGQQLARPDFHKHKADLATKLTALEARIAQAARDMRAAQQERLEEAERDMQALPDWDQLTQEESSRLLDGIQAKAAKASDDMAGLKTLIACQFDIESAISEAKKWVAREGWERRHKRQNPPPPPPPPPPEQKSGSGFGGAAIPPIKSPPPLPPPPRLRRTLVVPKRITASAELDDLIARLEKLRAEIGNADFDITFTD